MEISEDEIDEIAIIDFIQKNDVHKEHEKQISYNEAINSCQHTWIGDNNGLPAMLLGDVANIIKITTGKEVNWETLMQKPLK